jgi:Domain of unknown function (DUF4398)
MRQRPRHARHLAAPALFASAVALVACASDPPPTAEIAHARSAIERAENDGAAQLAPAPLQLAQGKLNQAQTASKGKEYLEAKRFAEQSQADAEYAGAVSRANRAQQAAGQMQQLERQRDIPTGR